MRKCQKRRITHPPELILSLSSVIYGDSRSFNINGSSLSTSMLPAYTDKPSTAMSSLTYNKPQDDTVEDPLLPRYDNSLPLQDLLSPRSKSTNSQDDHVQLRLGGGRSSQTRGGRLMMGFGVTTGLLLGLLMAAPLVLLYRQGVLVEGLKQALGKPRGDYAVFPTRYL